MICHKLSNYHDVPNFGYLHFIAVGVIYRAKTQFHARIEGECLKSSAAVNDLTLNICIKVSVNE